MENAAAGPNPSATRPGILDDLAKAPPALGSGGPNSLQEDQTVRNFLQGLLPGRSIQDLLAAKFYVNMRRNGATAQSAWTTVSAPGFINNLLLSEFVPIELSLRVKMDLNRPFGNGQDDTTQLYQWTNVASGGSWTANPVTFSLDPLNSLDAGATKPTTWPNTWQMDARQLYARHLYVLMMTLTDLESAYPTLTASQRARLVAQWAVNVVSFRDRSAVMPYFVYDWDPFTSAGWRVPLPVDWTNLPSDGDGRPCIVWGCKRPQLLITETLALHARRTEDLATEEPNPGEVAAKTTDPDPKKKDPDFDQRKRPLGSLFVELYNPANPLDADAGDTYDPSTGKWSGGISLNLAAGGHPAWRLIIVAAAEAGKDPDDPLVAQRPAIQRSVYFMDPTGLPGATGGNPDGQRYYASGPMAPILHDRYAVIGPPGDASVTPPGSSATPISHRTDAGGDAKCQRIVLTPNANPDAASQVQLLYSQLDTGADELPSAIKPPVAVVVDKPHRLNVSEPDDEYASMDVRGCWSGTEYDKPYDTPFDTAAALITDGMTPQYKIVYLQRLANPFMPFDATTNPYRTIDSMPVDLFAYNGWEDPNITEPGVTPATPATYRTLLHSRERGDGLLPPPMPSLTSNVWAAEPPPRPGAADTTPLHSPNLSCVGTQRPSLALQQTIGLLNKPFFASSTVSTPPAPRSAPAEYLGAVPPDVAPFSWLAWNSRPFVSELELPLVPYASSSMLLKTFWPTFWPSWPWPGISQSFPYLWDYFNPAGTTPPGPEFYRLLDLVGVPSPFVGTEIQGKPDVFALVDPDPSKRHTFYPPFNRIPNYREPGRVNLNTVPSTTSTTSNVWKGLWNDYWDTTILSTVSYDAFNTSRNNVPFRSYAGPILTSGPTANEVAATLLRPNGSNPLFALSSTADCNHTDRSPFFRYQGLQRLGNLTTTRSNVFAVWITVGYFQVQPWTIDAGHPDGYAIGAEVGADTGEIKRHRAFYIIDRSIPVGFQRGLDLNVEKAIVLKRYIE